MDFPKEVLLPDKTIFSKGAVSQIAQEVLEFGTAGLVVHGNSLKEKGKLESILNQFPSSVKVDSFCRGSGEPNLDEIFG